MRLVFQLPDPIKLPEGKQTDPTVSVITVAKEYQQLRKLTSWHAYSQRKIQETSTIIQ